MTTIGVRELRQNASQYLELVEAGETVEITNRGRLVALLTPASRSAAAMSREDLIARRLLIPGRGSLADLPSPPRREGVSASAILDELRGDR
ncbi:MAG TPA: type II toxin-antitoxin system prevent-host-death family antitoxin [Marmoricola sp.]|nr:type II toxin-antitoxin system prevent-host-death family antitoxin [Marmoricola sp.]